MKYQLRIIGGRIIGEVSLAPGIELGAARQALTRRMVRLSEIGDGEKRSAKEEKRADADDKAAHLADDQEREREPLKNPAPINPKPIQPSRRQ